MYKSWTDDDEKHEWNDIEEPEHVAEVWDAIASGFDTYFSSFVDPKRTVNDESGLGQLSRNPAFRLSKPRKSAKLSVSSNPFSGAIRSYEKDAPKYGEFFDADSLKEFRDDDPDSFKAMLSRRCPVIHKCIHSQREELKDWNIRYKLTSSRVLLSKFENLVSFARNYLDSRGKEPRYKTIDEPEDLQFEPVEDENVGVPGVVGGGIRTRILYNLSARVFPDRSGTALYGMYFLSGKNCFCLRSKTSEFLMIDDTIRNPSWSIKMAHNFWYPYRIFTTYALRISRLIERECIKRSLGFDTRYRYVYVDVLLRHVCDRHKQDLSVMRGQDEASSAM